ncbi:DDE family transposase [Desulfitobacterium sp. LBE]|uniref:IS701 family transposase n=1 Tax=Desulfitobacterium sp. LBE TaxID=884086 RepID=UPI00119B822D|nr:IS701 family transposase [Desulfitobacterium sp. LBE]TWH56975.1 DDE family transposase [Desulfitobacterium sp. LBE]
MSLNSILPNNEAMFNFFKSYRLPLYFSKPVLRHIQEFIVAATAKGYRGKVVDIAEWSSVHRTSIGHFLSDGVWDASYIQKIVQQESLHFVVSHSKETEQPLFVIHDDTVCNKTKPSSQAQRPIQQTEFHFSHLEGKSIWGHQVQATLVQCGNHSLIHTIHRYDKTKQSKIDDACELAKTMPIPPKSGYALVDSWYTCSKLMNTYAARGYQLIGALKTNRILYPQGIRVRLDTFASYVTQKEVRLVTVNGSSYWVYRYEGALNDIENAVVLLCWPKEAFQESKALHAFLCTDVSLETQTILDYYSRRWPVEIFFRQAKGNLGFNGYQVRSIRSIERLWTLLAFTHLYCTIGLGKPLPFGKGLRKVRKEVKGHYIQWIYGCGKKGIPLDDVLKHLKAG